ncbi:MAG: peptidoglycan D,D-transpeptidase FtsI family protein [Candidatus Pelagibacterales bacterium]|jgi:cell division protein FtsI (penicillin-binding protein 3)|tara:strand:- start:10690 stop:12429 length:1740 start_codon:yes stop_codon:yes gene_type:complete
MKRYSGKKRIDINQKSFAFTHRYDEDKFSFEKNLTKTGIFLTKINNRLILASLFITAIFLVVAIKIIEVNLFNQNEQSIFNKSYTEARGNILDRNNNPLTANLRLANIGVFPNKIYDKNKFVNSVKIIFPELSRERLLKKINGKSHFWIKRNVSNYKLQQVYDIGETGIEITPSYLRKYPHDELVSHILGDVDIDNIGIAGIEKSFNQKLVKNENEFISSIDIQIQYAVRDELLNGIKKYKALGASGILMDINSGEIISMVSLPDFNPNQPVEDIQSEGKYFNKNTLGVYEFGSVMKTFTTAIGLEENIFNLNTKFAVPKRIKVGKNRVEDVHAACDQLECSVKDIFVQSSNVGTIQMVRDIGTNLQQIYLDRLGLLSRININLPELASPQQPDPWRDVNRDSISYGYGLSISPLHLTVATAAVLNGGYLVKPSLEKINKEDLKVFDQIFSKKTSDEMKYLFNQVVLNGSAKEAFKESESKLIVGGKTGTARTIKNGTYDRDHKMTSFISVFPIHEPKYVLLTVIDRPRGVEEDFYWTNAGWNAAKVGKLIIDRIGPILAINSKYELNNSNLLINTSLQ